MQFIIFNIFQIFEKILIFPGIFLSNRFHPAAVKEADRSIKKVILPQENDFF